MESLKKEILELLDKDRDFRYAVAGYLGLSEVLKRLDNIAEEQVRLSEEQISLRKEQAKFWQELVEIKQEQVELRAEQVKLGQEQVRIREEQAKLRQEMVELRAEQVKLREDFKEMLKEIRSIDMRLIRVERTLEKLTLDIEEEARSIIHHRIKQELGLDVKLGPLTLPDLELNIYGASDDLCVVGEASVRAGAGLVDELLRKLNTLRTSYPDRLRRKMIPVIYTSLALPELIEKAAEKNLWVLKATEDIVKLQMPSD